MRGPPSINYRGGQKPRQLPNEAVGTPFSIPAPLGGWNARDALASMNFLDAVVMDNFYPGTSTVELRAGRIDWATGITGTVRSLMVYNSATVSKMFAGSSTGIYDVTASGAVGAAATTSINGRWESLVFSNSGGTFLVAVNGSDPVKNFNGTTWSNPAITGVTPANLNNVCLFKRRLWFVENNTMTAWYLPIDSIAGAATAFPMGPLFSMGGKLIAQATWTVDGGQGSDDYLATVSSQGQLAVYQGIDPATDFALVGVYDVGRPIGKKCFMKYGGDLLYLSERGIFLLSKLLLSATIDRTQASISNKIDGAVNEVVSQFRNNFGWEMIFYQTPNAIMLNIPIVEGAISYQYVMNNITKAWCRFIGWDATAFIDFNGNLYSCSGAKVHQAWIGSNDSGTPISGTVQQAYYSYKLPYMKSVTLVRPQLQSQGSATLTLGLDNDFRAYPASTQSTYMTAIGAVWDSSLWDLATWDTGVQQIDSTWLSVPNQPGVFYSFRLQFTTSNASLSWVSTDYLMEKAGIL